MATMQYAKIPQFQYQKFEGQHRYQSYNPQTLGYTYHPLSPKPASPVPEKDNKEVTDTEPEKENTEQGTEENPPAPAEDSPAPPQDEGK
jgi:hypothetical protein